MKCIKFKRYRGFSLIELVVALGILAGLYLLIAAKSDKADVDSKAQAEIENTNMIATSIRNFFGSSGTTGYSGLTNAVIYNSIPRNIRGSGTNIRNSWNSAGITVAPTAANSRFTITSAGIPESPCESIAAQTYQSFVSLAVNGTSVTSPSVASTACSGTTNTLLWTSN